MKKFIKIFIVVLLVIGVIGGTCYFFFSKYKDKNSKTESIVSILQSESKIKFDEDLSLITGYMKDSNSVDTRLDLIIDTSERLDDMLSVLSSYYVSTNTQIKNEEIAKLNKKVLSSRSLLGSMMNEYKIKTSSALFDRNLGANDLYKQSCAYLVDYANFVKLINENLVVNKTADLKFSMFEIYSNVVISTFAETETHAESKLVAVKHASNIQTMNTHMIISNSYIQTSVSQFAIEINHFNKFYNACNKLTFAKELSVNIQNVKSETQDTNEKIAAYYFKEIFGI
ncbi:MAG: hypothetical protein J6Q13_03690 [Clostridia bacterium]|nr:hypothetical protein [Clostridia bacterium]